MNAIEDLHVQVRYKELVRAVVACSKLRGEYGLASLGEYIESLPDNLKLFKYLVRLILNNADYKLIKAVCGNYAAGHKFFGLPLNGSGLFIKMAEEAALCILDGDSVIVTEIRMLAFFGVFSSELSDRFI